MSTMKRLAAAAAAATLLLTAGAVAVREEAHGQATSAPAASVPQLCAALLPSLPGFCITI